MLVKMYTDELYPVFFLNRPEEISWGDEIDIPRELYEDYIKMKDYFDQVQDKLNMVYDDHRKRKQLEECQRGIPSKGF